MTATALLQHQMPGRVRLKVPSRQGDLTFFESLVQALSRHNQVEELTAHPVTGGVIIRHSGPVQQIFSFAAEEGLFEVRAPETKQSRSQNPNPGEPSSRPGILDSIALGLFGLGAIQAARGRTFGSASENLWNAYGAQRVLGSPGIALAFTALGLYQFFRGEILSSASSLIFYALVSRHLAAEREQGAGSVRASPTRV